VLVILERINTGFCANIKIYDSTAQCLVGDPTNLCSGGVKDDEVGLSCAKNVCRMVGRQGSEMRSDFPIVMFLYCLHLIGDGLNSSTDKGLMRQFVLFLPARKFSLLDFECCLRLTFCSKP